MKRLVKYLLPIIMCKRGKQNNKQKKITPAIRTRSALTSKWISNSRIAQFL